MVTIFTEQGLQYFQGEKSNKYQVNIKWKTVKSAGKENKPGGVMRLT